MSCRGLDPNKLAYGKYANSPARNSPFLPQQWPKQSPVLIAPTHGGMVTLSGPEVAWMNTGMLDPPRVTNPYIYRLNFVDMTTKN